MQVPRNGARLGSGAKLPPFPASQAGRPPKKAPVPLRAAGISPAAGAGTLVAPARSMQALGRDRLVALVGLVLGVGTLALVPRQVDGHSLADISNLSSPAFFPILVALSLVAGSLLLVLRPGTAAEADERIEAPGRLALTAGWLVAYAVLLPLLGTVVSSVLSVLAMGAILGYRRWAVLTAAALAVPLAVYGLFRRLLYVLLPEGMFF